MANLAKILSVVNKYTIIVPRYLKFEFMRDFGVEFAYSEESDAMPKYTVFFPSVDSYKEIYSGCFIEVSIRPKDIKKFRDFCKNFSEKYKNYNLD